VKKSTDKSNSNLSKPEEADVNNTSASTVRPDIFQFHDYIEFLKIWFQFLKQNKKGFSLRQIAKERSFATGYLPMIISRQRPLSYDAMKKLLPALVLTKSEQQFFLLLHTLGTTNLQEERIETLGRMKKLRKYQDHHPQEAEVYEYLSKWHYYTIRELSLVKDFKLDAEWIQSRLRIHVPLQEIKEAIHFLTTNKYIETDGDGNLLPPQKHLNCEGGVFKIALSQYHKQLLHLADKSIENTPSEERYLKGHTFAISSEKFSEVQGLINELIEKIQKITDSTNRQEKDAVYHMEMALFPLTNKKYGSSHES
jgi:uncharacterized protein (TIGR02147 family)